MPSPSGPFENPRVDLFLLVHNTLFHGSAFIFEAPLPWLLKHFTVSFGNGQIPIKNPDPPVIQIRVINIQYNNFWTIHALI